MLDLTLLSKIMKWHKPHDNVGLFIPLPTDLAKKYPKDGRKGEDNSPEHVTLYYMGKVSKADAPKVLATCTEIIVSTPVFKIELNGIGKFTNKHNQDIIHSKVKSPQLHSLHSKIKQAMEKMGIKEKYPTYKPHVTIEYVDEGKESKYKDKEIKGTWNVDVVWLWGLDKPYPIFLK